VEEKRFEPPVPLAKESISPAEPEVPHRQKGSLESVVYLVGDRQFESLLLHRRVLIFFALLSRGRNRPSKTILKEKDILQR